MPFYKNRSRLTIQTPLFKFSGHVMHLAGRSGRAVYGVGLQPFTCWDCGLESRRGHGCLSVLSVVC